ncbi:MAG: hypothetical protein ACK55I_50665, partial [bacterium]
MRSDALHGCIVQVRRNLRRVPDQLSRSRVTGFHNINVEAILLVQCNRTVIEVVSRTAREVRVVGITKE